MDHWNFRDVKLLVAASLLLCCCSSPDSATSGAMTEAPAANAPSGTQLTPPPQTAAVQETSKPASSALLEFIDPATGQHREPTAAERAALQPPKPVTAAGATSDTQPNSREIVLSNGVVAVKAGEMSQINGCLQKDGHVAVEHDCSSDVPAAVKKP